MGCTPSLSDNPLTEYAGGPFGNLSDNADQAGNYEMGEVPGRKLPHSRFARRCIGFQHDGGADFIDPRLCGIRRDGAHCF